MSLIIYALVHVSARARVCVCVCVCGCECVMYVYVCAFTYMFVITLAASQCKLYFEVSLCLHIFLAPLPLTCFLPAVIEISRTVARFKHFTT